jgi:hypothetical protein
LSPRLVAGLLYQQHVNNASDEAVVNTWLEKPYWQYFCGEQYLQTELPINPPSLTRWRKRIGEEGVETLLAVTIEAARAAGLIRKNSVDTVIVDSTVMPKAETYPAQSKLLERSLQHLVNIVLRQNYNRQAPCMTVDFGVNYTQLGFVLTVFFASSFITQTASGFIVDTKGPRPILLTGLTLIVLGISGYALSTSHWMLLLSTMVQGVLIASAFNVRRTGDRAKSSV